MLFCVIITSAIMSPSRKFGIGIIVVALAAIAYAFIPPPPPETQPELAPPQLPKRDAGEGVKPPAKKAPRNKNRLQSMDLDEFNRLLKSLRGKVVIVNFWATWCRPCAMEMPHLIKLHDRHRDEGLVVLGVGDDVYSVETLEKYEAELGATINYRVLQDPTVDIRRSFAVTGLPKSVIFDRRGNRRKIYDGYGFGMEDEIGELVVKLLKEK